MKRNDLAKVPQPTTSNNLPQLLNRLFANIPLWIVLIPFLCCAVIAVATSRFWNQRDRREYLALMTELNSQGLPTDQGAFSSWYHTQTSTQGVADWLDVLCVMAGQDAVAFDEGNPFLGSDSRRINQEFNRDAWAEEPIVADILNRFRPLIEHIETKLVSTESSIRLPMRWEGDRTVLHLYSPLRKISRLLALEVEHSLYHGETERAMLSLQAMQTTYRAFNSNCLTIVSMISTATEREHQKMILRSLAADLWSDQQLASLMKLLETDRDYSSQWTKMVQSDTLAVIDMINTLEKGDFSGFAGGNGFFAGRPFETWFLDDSSSKTKLVRYYLECSRASEKGIEGLESRLLDLTKASYPEWVDRQLPKRFDLSRIFGSSLVLLGRAWEQREDDRRFTLTALGVKKYQSEFKAWPKDLSQLVKVGLDREDWTTTAEEPFGYMQDGESVVLWTYPTEDAHKKGRMGVPKTIDIAKIDAIDLEENEPITPHVRIR